MATVASIQFNDCKLNDRVNDRDGLLAPTPHSTTAHPPGSTKKAEHLFRKYINKENNLSTLQIQGNVDTKTSFRILLVQSFKLLRYPPHGI